MAKKKQNKQKEESALNIGLDVYTRLMLTSIFPERCSIEEYLTFDDIKKKITIDEKEQKELGLKVLNDGKTTTWNRKGNEDREFTFSKKEVSTILNVCELASRNKDFPNNTRFFKFYKEIKEFNEENPQDK